ncbi:MAG: hypothetical protein EOO62_22940 [Hymenobacter sp.]|nr:MAG: hypothetical protein EOO62_22940 [Hymenobacter sp.]
MDDQKRRARDNARTPMQWSAAANAGFTTGTPWLKINPNYPQVNVAAEDKNPESVLNYFRRAVAVRHAHQVLVYGKYQLLDADNPNIYAYTRTLGAEKALIVLNFSPEKHDWAMPTGFTASGQPWLNNYPAFATGSTLALQPWQAVVVPLR